MPRVVLNEEPNNDIMDLKSETDKKMLEYS